MQVQPYKMQTPCLLNQSTARNSQCCQPFHYDWNEYNKTPQHAACIGAQVAPLVSWWCCTSHDVASIPLDTDTLHCLEIIYTCYAHRHYSEGAVARTLQLLAGPLSCPHLSSCGEGGARQPLRRPGLWAPPLLLRHCMQHERNKRGITCARHALAALLRRQHRHGPLVGQAAAAGAGLAGRGGQAARRPRRRAAPARSLPPATTCAQPGAHLWRHAGQHWLPHTARIWCLIPVTPAAACMAAATV
mmetsp:Transcript_29343/g.74769  ORF Transcript_29343/g.74769 Transcript_29343/m.74769 type:complete len:245 (-) Transcript_29343:1977-2711(-)